MASAGKLPLWPSVRAGQRFWPKASKAENALVSLGPCTPLTFPFYFQQKVKIHSSDGQRGSGHCSLLGECFLFSRQPGKGGYVTVTLVPHLCRLGVGSCVQNACLFLATSHRTRLGKAVLSLPFHRCTSLQAASCLLHGYTSAGQMSLLLFQQHIAVLRNAAQRCRSPPAWSCPELPGPETCKSPCTWLQKPSALCSLEMEVSATARGTVWGWGRWPWPSWFLSGDPREGRASRTPTYSLILKQQWQKIKKKVGGMESKPSVGTSSFVAGRETKKKVFVHVFS